METTTPACLAAAPIASVAAEGTVTGEEFDFRYSNRAALGVNDTERTARAVKDAVGKRLTYRTARSAEAETPAT
jgi:hypothetical protein